MRALHGLVAIVTLVIATSAAAEDPVSITPVPEASPSPPAKERLICRNQVVTGSRIKGKRLCMTKQAWHDYDLDTQKAADSMQRRGTFRTD